MLYRAEKLQRRYGSRTVLNIDNLEIQPNLVYTLIGPNGAGKTSLLNILAFLDRPTSGNLYFLDTPVSYGKNHLYELRRHVVLLDQSPIMFTGSVWKNVEFGLKVRGVERRKRKQKILEALELVGMESFAQYDARGLSGGETKRVALARALILEPKVLLCDEPTANVDGENQEIILKILERINKEKRCSIIFSTHYLSQAQRLADQTLLLQQGSLSDITNENIYRITIVDRNEQYLICQLTGQLLFKIPVGLFPENTKLAKLHIDPNLVVMNPDTTNPAAGNLISGHITDLSQDSGQVRITADIGVKLILALPMDKYRLDKPCLGDKVHIYIPHSSIDCMKIDQAG